MADRGWSLLVGGDLGLLRRGPSSTVAVDRLEEKHRDPHIVVIENEPPTSPRPSIGDLGHRELPSLARKSIWLLLAHPREAPALPSLIERPSLFVALPRAADCSASECMTERPSHDEYLASVRAQALECARSVLAARMTLIEGVRRLIALLRELDDAMLKSVHTSLIAVDRETDSLPVGPVREVWAPLAVAEKNREVAEAEARHRVSVAEACRQILHHLELIDCINLERYRDERDK